MGNPAAPRSTPANKNGLEAEPIPDASVRLCLEKIASSRPFANAPRSTRFLRFIVEERLAGRLDRIQEYVLGLDVFDRKETFDPRIDSIVRVEGRRLRLRLQDYYQTDGRTDRIRIELPKRGYVPEFRFAAAPKLPIRRALLIGFTVLLVVAIAAITVRLDRRSMTEDGYLHGPIAVLPFTNLSGDPEHEPLATGMTDALITELARLPALHVISRTSIVAYEKSKKSAPVIARELGARLLLEGAVSRSGTRIRLTAQLIDARKDRHIWAQSYEREITDIFQVQNDLVRRVAQKVHIQVSPELDQSLSTAPVVSEKALDAYWKGRFAHNQRTGEAALRAAAFFEEAIREEPAFALPHAWLAAAYRTASTMGDSSPAELLPRALDEARKGVDLAPHSSDTHSSLAVSLALDWNWTEAEQHFLRALQLSPRDAEAHHRYAILYLAPLGRLQEADAEIRAAVELDRASLNHRVILGKILYFRGRYKEASAELLEVLKMDPNYADGLRNLGAVYVRMQRFVEAETAYRKSQSIAPTNWGAGLLAHSLAQSGKQRDARKILQGLLDRSEHTPGMALAIATAFAGLGEQDQALRWLESARADKEVRLMLVNVDPMYEPLRPRAEFRRLCTALGLVPPPAGHETRLSRQIPAPKGR